MSGSSSSHGFEIQRCVTSVISGAGHSGHLARAVHPGVLAGTMSCHGLCPPHLTPSTVLCPSHLGPSTAMAVPSTSVTKHCHVPCPSHLGPRHCALHIWHRAPPCPVPSTSVSRHRHTPCPPTPGTEPCHGPCPPHLALSPTLGVTPRAQPAQVLSEHAHQICLYPPLPPIVGLADKSEGFTGYKHTGKFGIKGNGKRREGEGRSPFPSQDLGRGAVIPPHHSQ